MVQGTHRTDDHSTRTAVIDPANLCRLAPDPCHLTGVAVLRFLGNPFCGLRRNPANWGTWGTLPTHLRASARISGTVDNS